MEPNLIKIKEHDVWTVWKRIGRLREKETRYIVKFKQTGKFDTACKNLKAVDRLLKKIISLWSIAMLFLCLSVKAWADDGSWMYHRKAVKAIVGEAEGEPFAGKLAIAHALRNRAQNPHYRGKRVFKGVYGLKRKTHAPKRTWHQADRAWKESSQKKDNTGHATIWGTDSDVRKFRKEEWFRKCRFTTRIGNHSFFREAM